MKGFSLVFSSFWDAVLYAGALNILKEKEELHLNHFITHLFLIRLFDIPSLQGILKFPYTITDCRMFAA